MAHSGQKITFRRIGLLRRGQRRRQFFLLALFSPHNIGHISAHNADPPQLSADIKHFKTLNPYVSVFIPHLRHKGIGILIL